MASGVASARGKIAPALNLGGPIPLRGPPAVLTVDLEIDAVGDFSPRHFLAFHFLGQRRSTGCADERKQLLNIRGGFENERLKGNEHDALFLFFRKLLVDAAAERKQMVYRVNNAVHHV